MGAYPAVRVTSQSKSSPLVINLLSAYSPYFSPGVQWALGVVVTLSSGANLTYSVEVTADQVPTATGNWNSHDTLVALTASANGNVGYPITGIRLNVTSFVSGTANMGVVQWP